MIRNGENMTLEDIQTKIDPENIFLMGDSSSGNTAFITAFTADMNCMDTDVYKEYSCKVNAVVDLYGVSCKNQRRLSNNTKPRRARQPGRIRNRQ